MRRTASILCALLLAIGLGACSGDDEHPEDHEENGTSQTTASGAGTTGTEAGSGEGGEPGDGGDEHEHHNADFPAAEATDIAKISMRDYAFVDMPATVTGPRVRFEVKNNGPSAHELVVFDADGNEVGGIEPVPPGDSATVSLELTAGTYEMRCQIAISDTKTHLDEGMKAVFQVT